MTEAFNAVGMLRSFVQMACGMQSNPVLQSLDVSVDGLDVGRPRLTGAFTAVGMLRNTLVSDRCVDGLEVWCLDLLMRWAC